MAKNIIVLADGTGNSAASATKTNIWRLYQALDLSTTGQVALFDDGVGTSWEKITRFLGLAFGLGLKKNVIELYEYICRNYNCGDSIYCFGFSRGAFTIRILAGLIGDRGLFTDLTNEEELHKRTNAAYRAYREKSLEKMWWKKLWKKLTKLFRQGDRNDLIVGNCKPQIQFLGLWDTVAAYGLPLEELSQFWDKLVYPIYFRDQKLPDCVKYARHALSLDDERRTFHPIPLDRVDKDSNESLPRLQQVWFSGVHANVGGGYADDGLACVSLCWMIKEAVGLHFNEQVVKNYENMASYAGRLNDSRSGLGFLYRYHPRNVKELMKDAKPLVHHSVLFRIARTGYAPISLPDTFDVLPPVGAPIPFNASEGSEGSNTEAQAQEKTDDRSESGSQTPISNEFRVMMEELRTEIKKMENAQIDNASYVNFMLDTVWWRRVSYFVSLLCAIIVFAFPVWAKLLPRWPDDDTTNANGEWLDWLEWLEYYAWWLDDFLKKVAKFLFGFVNWLLPSFTSPWLDTISNFPFIGIIIVSLLGVSLYWSSSLQQLILNRARAVWKTEARNGQNATSSKFTHFTECIFCTFLLLFGVGLWFNSQPLVNTSMVSIFGAFIAWAVLQIRGEGGTANKPSFFLQMARKLRNSKSVCSIYNFVAEYISPMVFFLITFIIIVMVSALWVNRAIFDFRSTLGLVCATTPAANIRVGDIKKMDSLILTLQEDSTDETKGISSFIWKKFDQATQIELKSTSRQRREDALVKALNEVVEGDSIYDETLFKKVKLSPETKYIKKNLDENKKNNKGFSLFGVGDIIDAPSLIKKLKNDSNESTRLVSLFIWKELDQATKQLRNPSNSTSSQQESALVQALNMIIQGNQGNSFYEQTRFADVDLRPETQSLTMQNPTGERLILLNRLLMEDAYPLDIKRTGVDLIRFNRLLLVDAYPKYIEKNYNNEYLMGTATFQTKLLCNKTPFFLEEGGYYRITMNIKKHWFDDGTKETDVGGFEQSEKGLRDRILDLLFLRFWGEKYFQPIARIGEAGNDEYILRPKYPFPKVHYDVDCVTSKAGDNDLSEKDDHVACETQHSIVPHTLLVSEITARKRGNLYLYVNDEVVLWSEKYYRHNMGSATVSVERVGPDGQVDKVIRTHGPLMGSEQTSFEAVNPWQ